MNKYKSTLTIIVTVEAFDESDAKDILEEHFGVGEDSSVDVLQLRVGELEQLIPSNRSGN